MMEIKCKLIDFFDEPLEPLALDWLLKPSILFTGSKAVKMAF
jgi:hypothetical protein